MKNLFWKDAATTYKAVVGNWLMILAGLFSGMEMLVNSGVVDIDDLPGGSYIAPWMRAVGIMAVFAGSFVLRILATRAENKKFDRDQRPSDA